MRYFRPTGEPNDRALLPVALRDHADLAGIADRAEDLVLGAFTHQAPHCDATILDEGTAIERSVWLRGFTADPEQAPASLAAALRREIAGVVRWLAAQDDTKPNLTSEAAGEPMTSKHYREDAEQTLPPGFGAAVRPFVIGSGRPVAWSI